MGAMRDPASWDAAAPPELLAGRYRPVALVGRGAIAQVVRAWDEQTGRDVALKMLHPHLRDNAVVVERFRREVDVVRRIAHPHVLPIHQVVETRRDLFLVMDYHPGGDLADRLARAGRLAPGELVELARQLCGALAAAHRAGVVHRDVKPSNVLCGETERLDVRLCDFGLARTTEASGLTVANAVLGTPEYMAPEVIAEGQADPRSDIYSLGVVLFEAATGRLPFYADSPYQLMRQHLDVEAPRARSLAPALSEPLDWALARALSKDPLDRFATVEDFAAALTEARAAAPVVPHPTRAACPACGGWLVQAAATCADCGARTLRLERRPRGLAVLVTGPGKVGDKLDAVTHSKLSKIVHEMSESESTPRRRRPPRLPFYVARALTPESATMLEDRLRQIGLATMVVRPGLWGAETMRKKARVLFKRSLVLAGSAQIIGNVLPHVGGPSLTLAGISVLFGSAFVSAVGNNRSLIRPTRRPSLSPPMDELTRALAGLSARQDRRLVARVIERLGQVARAGAEPLVAPLAGRAALATRGLVSVDEGRAAGPGLPAGNAVVSALAVLRREEQARMVFRADLLRTASRLDSALIVLARAEASGAEPALAEVEAALDRFSEETSAEHELQQWLNERR